MPKSQSLSTSGPSVPTSSARKPLAVAVTGANGFLGSNLVGSLEEDDRVGRIVAIDSGATATSGRKTRYYEVDLTQPAAEARGRENPGGLPAHPL